MEVLRIKVYLTDQIAVDGCGDKAVLLPFTGECDGPLFKGKILPGGVDTQRIDAQGRCALSARYVLEGMDDQGQPCRIFIQNEGVSAPGQELLTHPIIRTDSESLRWLETAALIGRIEDHGGHIEIVLTNEDSDEVKHIALRRGGLTLRGVLEKKAKGPCPLVLMLHGFGGCMDAAPGGWFQAWSDALTAAGFATLRFDFNGHGQSDGDFREMTLFNEIEDAAAFLRYAMKLPDVTEICLLGHSQGGVVAGMLAGYYHDVVSKLALLAPAASLQTDAQKGECFAVKYDPRHIPEVVPVGPGVGGLYYRIAQTLPIYDVAAQFGGPVLAVIGGQDGVIDPASIRRYGEQMPRCQVAEFPTLDHGLCGAEQEAARIAVVNFLQKGGLNR